MSITPDLVEWLIADPKVKTFYNHTKHIGQNILMKIFLGLPVMEKVGHSHESLVLYRIHPEPREEQLRQPENVVEIVELRQAGELQRQEPQEGPRSRGEYGDVYACAFVEQPGQ